MNILIVDNDPDRARGIGASFPVSEYSVLIVDSIDDLETAVTDHHPGLVVFGIDLYHKFDRGRIREAVHRPLRHSLEEKVLREQEMISAIERNEFILYYQPIVSLSTGTITGFEALMRWQHPEKGLIAPDNFIPLAEESGLIISLGFFAIAEASRQLKAWHDEFGSTNPLTVSINLSTVQFIHPDLADTIHGIVNEYGLVPGSVRFEITESSLMKDMESANIALLRLKSSGYALYMDDFGTGYSSLSYLRHFPVDVLKIDKSFVRWMGVDEESDEIVRIIIHLAHTLKMQVVAEGVETSETLEKLRELGAEFGQGYLFAKPLPPRDVEALLRQKPVW